MTKSPVFVVSAARSGSKLLRATLAATGDFSECPYDANYVWKYGNYRVSHDELSPSDVSQHQAERIRKFFAGICARSGDRRLLEKTVSNSLRVPFVRRVFPEGKIIHLYRDGRSTVSSTLACWQEDATSERIQTAADRRRKLKEFPFVMAWPYLLEYAKTYGRKRLFGLEQVDSWGPRYRGIDEDVRIRRLPDVCALQWATCVERSVEALGELRHGQDYINVAYEDFVADPEGEIDRINDFANMDHPDRAKAYALDVVDQGRAKGGRYASVEFSSFAEDTIARGDYALRELVGKRGN